MVKEKDTRLDCLGLKALELMQQIVKLKLKLQESIKVGSINLARSRYIKGNQSVSASQLPTEDSLPFSALCKIERSKADLNGLDCPSFTLLVQQPSRKQKGTKTDAPSDSIDESQLSCDPLDWFGVLVPQNLRFAQQSYKEAIDLSVKIANLQTHLEALRLEFCTLKLEQIKLL